MSNSNPWSDYLSTNRKISNNDLVNKRERSSRSAIEGKCFDCTGGYADGYKDCEITYCPLYRFMPYRKLNPDFTWSKIYTKRHKNVSEEERVKIGERLKLSRQTKFGK